ncbi:hypothetical protein [Kribbella sp. ALI-6-A]|uniref:hypothetical protein n=1 Tax=Kribbella sp. ALI-6-A TaxID=1933817 RepID=UPI00117B92C4|nr:hypothetical protein [Kribbella sp. ALI-6-A]
MANAWGWNPDSFEAIGTVAAFAVGFVALAVTLNQQRRLQDEHQLRHARLVDVQLVQTEPRQTSSHLRDTIIITNAGALPIHMLKPVIGGVWIHPRHLGRTCSGQESRLPVQTRSRHCPFCRGCGGLHR